MPLLPLDLQDLFDASRWLQAWPHLWWLWLALSASVGSFLSVVVHRLPRMLDAWADGREAPCSLSRPSSHCPSCGHRLALWDNLPLVGWLLLRGRCRYCRTPYGAGYLGLEALATAWGLGVFFWFSSPVAVLAWSVFGWTLLAAGWMDARTQWLPDRLTLTLLWAGLLYAGQEGSLVSAQQALWGATWGYASLAVLGGMAGRVLGREALGGGDPKLLAALGAWLGGAWLPWVVTLAFGLTLLAVIALRIAARRRASATVEQGPQVPLGPGLALAAVAVFFWIQFILR